MMHPAFVILFQAAVFVACQAQNQIPDLTFGRGESFKISVLIRDVNSDYTERHRYQLEEAYSKEQKRTVLQYGVFDADSDGAFRRANLPEVGTIVTDDNESALLIGNSGGNNRWCQVADQAKLDNVFRIDLLKRLLADQFKLSDGLYGPSSILFLFSKIKKELQPVMSGLSFSIHNVPSEMFKRPADRADRVQLFFYYAKSRIGGAEKALPLRISVDYPEGRHIEYDFWSLPNENIEQAGISVAKPSAPHADELVFDEFFIERAKGCSALIDDDKPESKAVARLAEKMTSFSFQARAQSFLNGRDMLAEVAYQKDLNLMRVDRQTGSRGSNLLIDFSTGKTYRSRTVPKETFDFTKKSGSTSSLTLQNAEASECILIKSPKAVAHLERMLLGSKGSWLYLGQARVRGLQVRVYEAHDTDWPMWLQQPVTYTRNWFSDKAEQEFVRDARGDASKTSKLTTVIYLTGDPRSAKSRVSSEQPQIVHMEIFSIQEVSRKIMDVKTISMFDFAWQINKLPNWPDTSSIFSMANQCDAVREMNQHLKVDMMMTRTETRDNEKLLDSLGSSHPRDLSVLEGLQKDLGLPAPLIFDLRSRLSETTEEDKKTSKRTNRTMISVSFRMAKGKQNLVKLRFYGTGKINREHESRLTRLRASLRDCFYLTAHQKANAFFGYSDKKSLCVADLALNSSVLVHRTDIVKPRSFEVLTNGPLDIYFVHHDEQEEEPSLVAKFRDNARRSSEAERQLHKKIFLADPANIYFSISFLIRNFAISEVDSPDARESSMRNLHFALEPDSSLTRVFSLEEEGDVNANHHRAMDLETCRTACLVDFECKALSVCLRGAQIECVLTSIDFDDGNLYLQLTDILSEPSNYGSQRKYKLKADLDKEITIRQSANCELHRKSYLDIFAQKRISKRVDPDQMLLLPVTSGPEECARKCFARTLMELHYIDQSVESTLGNIIDELERGETLSMQSISSLDTNRSQRLCSEFSYVGMGNLVPLSNDAINKIWDLVKTTKNPSGFCIEPKEGIKPKFSEDTPVIKVEEFSFKFETIYERRRNVRLLASKRTVNENEIYKKVAELGELPKNLRDLETLKNLMISRKNSQTVVSSKAMDETACAKACTLQTGGPWPACKSFDLLVVNRGINLTSTICHLNSISYADAIEYKQEALLDTDLSYFGSLTHYEPKFNSLIAWHIASRDGASEIVYHSKATWVFLFLGLTMGLIAGVARIFKINNRQRSDSFLIPYLRR